MKQQTQARQTQAYIGQKNNTGTHQINPSCIFSINFVAKYLEHDQFL